MRAIALAAAFVLALGGCGDEVVTRVLHRDNCNVCHEPLDDRGRPSGIEDIHPWRPLACAECHGGNPRVCDGALGGSPDDPTCDGAWLYDKTLAHPPAGPALRGLSPAELDLVDPAWLRFVNPADLRVQSQTCGRCHTDVVARVRRSDHALQTGDIAIARVRSGLQPTTTPRFGVAPQLDPRPDPSDPCTTGSVTRLSPLPIDPSSSDPRTAPTTSNAIDHLLVTTCVGCHVTAFGPAPDAAAPGAHRSSGCAACHVAYAPDGRSVSGDPWVDRLAVGHPLRHEMQASPRMSACLACHDGGPSDGASIGRSFRGLLPDLAAAGLPPPDDLTTPPDVHFEAGMGCVDCHHAELHGDGRIGGDATCAEPRVACQDCHGTRDAPAEVVGSRHRLARDGDRIVLTTLAGPTLEVPQLAPDDAIHGARHDALACSTCHAGWMPNCYGCHIDVNLSLSAPSLTTGALMPGVPSARVLAFDSDTQVLAVNARGEIQGAMLAERLFVTLRDGATPLVTDAPRTGADGLPARGLRPIDPHTTRRASPLGACDRCHATGSVAAPDNRERLDRTHGFGSDRHVFMGDRLDAALAPDGSPLVSPGHAGVRPLSPDEITRMRAVLVPTPR
ncbi:MAG: hypothetical protein IT385_16280 [Deltaproteobacteria bacterium]|nr:hypothetical protein [Deltaproteobacteria bacterium]